MGYYVPEKVLTNFDLEKMVDTSNDWIVERTGIRERHIAAPEQATSDLALIAAQRALEDAGVAAEELDLIVVGTESPDMKFPQWPAFCRTSFTPPMRLPLTWRPAAPVLCMPAASPARPSPPGCTRRSWW